MALNISKSKLPIKTGAIEKGLENFKAEAPGAVKNSHDETDNDDDNNKKEKGFEALVAAYTEEHKCNKTEAIKAIVKSHPEEHKKYLEKAQG